MRQLEVITSRSRLAKRVAKDFARANGAEIATRFAVFSATKAKTLDANVASDLVADRKTPINSVDASTVTRQHKESAATSKKATIWNKERFINISFKRCVNG